MLHKVEDEVIEERENERKQDFWDTWFWWLKEEMQVNFR